MRVHGRRVLLETGWKADTTVVVERGRIAAIDDVDPGADLVAEVLAPGLIDAQYNGGFGVEIGADAAPVVHVASRLPATGVTAFLPTLVTSPGEVYAAAFASFAEAKRAARGAAPLGLHLEGPFLSPDAAGAHRRELLERADDALFERILAGCVDGVVALVTLAPELPGAARRVATLVERGVVVSLGHTRATFEQVVAGADAGATMVTHLYNAMSRLEHRAPGAVGAALLDDRLVCGLIVDGVHAHDAATRLALRAKGPAKIALVTDAMAAAGMGPGAYELGGLKVVVDATSVRLPDGTLAGSILSLDAAVRNVVALGASRGDALRMASEVPARVLGLANKGRIVAGVDADLTLFDDALHVRATLVGGQVVYAAR